MKTALHNVQFLNSPEDCKWIRETALRGLVLPPFASFLMAGNEDCPSHVTLYTSANPDHDEKPAARLVYCAELNEYL
jgi:hypothetical protein